MEKFYHQYFNKNTDLSSELEVELEGRQGSAANYCQKQWEQFTLREA